MKGNFQNGKYFGMSGTVNQKSNDDRKRKQTLEPRLPMREVIFIKNSVQLKPVQSILLSNILPG